MTVEKGVRTGKEYEHVPWGLVGVNLEEGSHGSVKIILLRFCSVVYFNRVLTTPNV